MKSLFVEVADNSFKRELGLMNRKTMAQNQGMLFVFPSSSTLSFWMKNTYLPLDIAFLDEEGRIMQISEMIPLNTRPIKSKEPCKYALEVNKGWFKNNNISEGDFITGEGIKIDDIKTAQQRKQAPVIMLNKSFRDILNRANIKNQDILIYYQKKDGYILAPKLISPPFLFEPDATGKTNNIVKAWDNQDAEWKSFLIDHILDLQLADDEYIGEEYGVEEEEDAEYQLFLNKSQPNKKTPDKRRIK